MTPLRVLITNNTLAGRAGSELYVRDLALALLARGHRPVALSAHLGVVAAELRAATVPTIDHPRRLGEPPDIIHGHHHLDTAMALCAFPDAPAVYICHGWTPWEEAPPRLSRVGRYLAVDEVCRERLVAEHGFGPAEVEVLPNFVDLARFAPRPPLPTSPRRAVLFSNSARGNGYASVVAAACAQCDIELDVYGAAIGQPVEKPGAILGQYDVVFAKARAALEAMAVGCAVILCDEAGAGPLVTADLFNDLRPLNFGVRTLRHAHTTEYVAEQLRRYDADDAATVCAKARAVGGMDAVIDRLVAVYAEVIAEARGAVANRADELRQYGEYLRWLAPRTVDLATLHDRIGELSCGLDVERRTRESTEIELERLRATLDGERQAWAAERERLVLEAEANVVALPVRRLAG